MKTTAQTIWNDLKNTPVNNDMEIDQDFLHFEKGCDVYTIWKWIEDNFNVSIVQDLN